MPLHNLLSLSTLFIFVLPAQGQFLEKFTFEAGYNRSKIFNTAKIITFEVEDRRLLVQREHEPTTFNMSTSLGFSFSKKHHLRLRRSKTILGSILSGNIEVFDSFGNSFDRPITHNDTKIVSTSLGIIYEYHSSFHEGNIVFGIGFEKQKNKKFSDIILFPGLRHMSYSIHTHIGYMTPIFETLQVHAKVLSSYYFPNNHQYYQTLISSAYAPLQLGIEVGLRIQVYRNHRNPFIRRKRKTRFTKIYY